jgi:CRP-like cAMP-binding protein
MISPELLRRFPFFAGFNDNQLKSLAMIAEENNVLAHATIFEEGKKAENFFILISGSVDLSIKSEEVNTPGSMREFAVGEINPGEVFGINALLEPYKHGFTERAAQDCKLIEFDGLALRTLMEEDKDLAYQLMLQISRTLIDRLYSTRIQLAAAWA